MSQGTITSPKSEILYHVVAILTSAVWGTTFVSSKLLLEEGMTPAEIMFLRFAMAYVCMIPFIKGKLFCNNWRDEALMMLLGISGGSLYFLLENSALLYTQASNVAIIIAATPLLTTLAVHLISHQEKVSKRLYGYSLLSLSGVALVVFNGEFILKLNPLGDILTLGAALMWVIYSIVVVKMEKRYDSLMITRKVFFYGVLTLLPYFAIEPFGVTIEMLTRPIVIGNLLFLGLLASLICYWTWNVVIIKLGAVRSTNYLYINPIIAMITSYFVLNEHITSLAIIGTALILTGMYLAQRQRR
ncbi:MAG: DMT family transporter [Rikenellaceae bacterium]|nr:DMT family transporter [Rikenellaceae bacterium]